MLLTQINYLTVQPVFFVVAKNVYILLVLYAYKYYSVSATQKISFSSFL